VLCDGYVHGREQSSAVERHKAVLATQAAVCEYEDNAVVKLQLFSLVAALSCLQNMAPSTCQRSASREQPVRTTFGRLEGVSDCVVLPSTLGYRERQVLQKSAGFEYGK
jgi:hypothetical protein